MEELALGIVWYAVLLFSLTVHEAAHAWAAQRGGDPTAYLGGQVSLDPRPHIQREPFGTVAMPILSFVVGGFMIGWASTPYDPYWAARHPRRAGWMALAGPASNLALVLGAAAVIHAGMLAGVFWPPDSVRFGEIVGASPEGPWPAIALTLSITFTLNLLLCVFNLIPLPPLDGSGAVALLVSEDSARRFQEFFHSPGMAIGGLIFAWIVIRELFWPIHALAISLLYPAVRYSY